MNGACEFCHKGLYTNCLHGGFWGQANDGGQAEAIRAPFADATLVVVPKSVEGDEALLKAILPLTDVMGTGHYAAVLAGFLRTFGQSLRFCVATLSDGSHALPFHDRNFWCVPLTNYVYGRYNVAIVSPPVHMSMCVNGHLYTEVHTYKCTEKDTSGMNPTLVGYLGFVVAALILIWAVIEISRRLTRHKKADAQTLGTWVKLDSTRNNAPEELLPIENDEDDDGDQDEFPERSIQTRAQQNGHYSESKKPS